MSFQLTVSNTPSSKLTFSNLAYVNTDQKLPIAAYFKLLNPISSKFGIFKIKRHEKVPLGKIALSGAQRSIIGVEKNKQVDISVYDVPPSCYAVSTNILIAPFKTNKQLTVEYSDLVDALQSYINHVFLVGQTLIIEHPKIQKTFLKLQFNSFNCASQQDIFQTTQSSTTHLLAHEEDEAPEIKSFPSSLAVILSNTKFVFERQNVKISGSSSGGPSNTLIRKDWDFDSMGIGGLSTQFNEIFQRAFVSRCYPSDFLRKIGQKHCRGLLLFGPPGTGKTLIAREIAKMLNVAEIKLVGGPSILSKFVGDSEKNIRELFAKAEEDQKKNGDDSGLHLIIMDEIDAICKRRGSGSTGGTGVGDSIVNQLLSKIDGVDSLNNVLIIGMTNRIDMLDEALLRPGRLEIQIEIGLPSEDGRHEILSIHTKGLRREKVLAGDVNLKDLAHVTKNYSGAELEGLVRAATSRALYRNNNLLAGAKVGPSSSQSVYVSKDDFEHALTKVKSAFGKSEDWLGTAAPNGFINWGPSFKKLQNSLDMVLKNFQTSKAFNFETLLLFGNSMSGTTAIASKCALDSKIPFVKCIQASALLTYSERGRISYIESIFQQAYKSPFSMIVIDDIEVLLEYVSVGPRFSNIVLQGLISLCKTPPPPGKRLFIVGTTSTPSALKLLGLSTVFSVKIQVPDLTPSDIERVLEHLDFGDAAERSRIKKYLKATSTSLTDTALDVEPEIIGIKRLLRVLEYAKMNNDFVGAMNLLGNLYN